MSIESLAIALHHSRASGTAKVVVLGIANHDGDGGAYPSVETLAKYANVSGRAVQGALATLVELGELRVHVKGGGMVSSDPRYRTNRYELLIECPPDCDRTTQHRRPAVKDSSPLELGPVVKSGAASGEGQRGPEVKPASPKPSLNTPENQLTPLSDADASLDAATLALDDVRTFDQFWQLYPRKVARKAAGLKWRMATTGRTPTKGAVIIAGLRPWLEYWAARNEPEFVPHPATWLHQQRWTDAPPAPTQRARASRVIDTDRDAPEGQVSNW